MFEWSVRLARVGHKIVGAQHFIPLHVVTHVAAVNLRSMNMSRRLQPLANAGEPLAYSCTTIVRHPTSRATAPPPSRSKLKRVCPADIRLYKRQTR
jgi:hypothetical protein